MPQQWHQPVGNECGDVRMVMEADGDQQGSVIGV
jgi:hypothetical protein